MCSIREVLYVFQVPFLVFVITFVQELGFLQYKYFQCSFIGTYLDLLDAFLLTGTLNMNVHIKISCIDIIKGKGYFYPRIHSFSRVYFTFKLHNINIFSVVFSYFIQ